MRDSWGDGAYDGRYFGLIDHVVRDLFGRGSFLRGNKDDAVCE